MEVITLERIKRTIRISKAYEKFTVQLLRTNQSGRLRERSGGFRLGSIRNLHIHVAECYHSWLGTFALKQSDPIADVSLISNVSEMRRLFKDVDNLVSAFLDTYEGREGSKISGNVSWQQEEEELTVLWLLTHTLSHEFHHKGQIVSIARKLGYVPEDTDLIVPGDLAKYIN